MSETRDGKFRFTFGVPTEPDVKILREKIGVPSEGSLIPYGKVTEILGLDRYADRFKTVTNAWRKELFKEHNVVLEAVPNEGWKCLPPNERIHFSHRRYGSGLRRVWRASNIAEKTDREKLGKDETIACDHLRKCAAAIRLAVATAGKPIKFPDPQIEQSSTAKR